jgi:hypothetical protein
MDQLPLLQRQRRVASLCCHCIRNTAYHKAWGESGRPHTDKDFWVNATGNFIDIAVMEWCKLFAEWDSPYHYRKVAAVRKDFREAMLKRLGKSQAEWDAYVSGVKIYRDKYIAHWEEKPPKLTVPALDLARDSAIFLMDWLTERSENDANWPAPQDGTAFYEQRKEHALAAYDATYL